MIDSHRLVKLEEREKKKSLPNDKPFLTFQLFVIYYRHKILIPKTALKIIIITSDVPGATGLEPPVPCSRGVYVHAIVRVFVPIPLPCTERASACQGTSFDINLIV